MKSRLCYHYALRQLDRTGCEAAYCLIQGGGPENTEQQKFSRHNEVMMAGLPDVSGQILGLVSCLDMQGCCGYSPYTFYTASEKEAKQN